MTVSNPETNQNMERTRTTEVEKKLTFEDNVIKKITGITASEVSGIIGMKGNFINELADRITTDTDPTKGIDVDLGDSQVGIKMTVSIEYGANAQKIYQEALRRVRTAVREMTGLELVSFEMNVDDVKTKEELADKNRKQQEQHRQE
ncbi:Asp23/Gls24 family envelope stress response protein [Lapidilactobacillus mulanensis]|uniref:Stress response regulator gls24 homolog n=1 Tax=Lapidilactobacillus mulanensis TaxID=2485999 RepID=A0ABW4DQR4_9LACO|nr:Asp23/Gls24 family envelope stress response protein [Lapidilactobacillus mulanensis]